MTEYGLVAKGTKQKVHLQQGSMDGACAVYSMMMCLIIIRAIHRSAIEELNDEKINGNTAQGRLIKQFLYNNGFVRKGYYLDKLEEDLQHTYKKIIDTYYFSIDDEDFLNRIIDELNNNNPVELGYDYKGKHGHAVVAIGYEEIKTGYLLYVLDPGYPMPYGQYWNNVIKIDTTSIRKYCAYNSVEQLQIQINEALVITKKSLKN